MVEETITRLNMTATKRRPTFIHMTISDMRRFKEIQDLAKISPTMADALEQLYIVYNLCREDHQ
jgi:hypothetical protein